LQIVTVWKMMCAFDFGRFRAIFDVDNVQDVVEIGDTLGNVQGAEFTDNTYIIRHRSGLAVSEGGKIYVSFLQTAPTEELK